MHILVTGADGFIARAIVTTLLEAGHSLTVCVRRGSLLQQLFPALPIIQADFLHDTSREVWLPRLRGVDVVINCVGIFQASEKNMWQIHYHTPLALFKAAVAAGVQKIIHFSALGIDQVDVCYAKSKLALEEALAQLTIDSVILRPSFVYGSGSYGGSSLFRGLAGLPGVLLLPGNGQFMLQPIHIEDLAKVVKASLTLSGKHLLYAGGEEKISLKALLNQLRAWLGFKPAFNISIPTGLIKVAAKLGDWMKNSPLSTTGVKLMQLDNVLSQTQWQQFIEKVGIKPRGFSQMQQQMVSSTQDRWHARLYSLRPLLRVSIGIVWIVSGLVSLLPPYTQALHCLAEMGISTSLQSTVLWGASLLDILLGVATLANFQLRWIGGIQVGLIIFYSLLISWFLPSFWLQPFGPLTKNIPLLVATLMMMALAKDR